MTRTSVPQTHPPGNGWQDWCSIWRHDNPYRHHLVEAWRREWQAVEVLRIADLDPAFNVAGLYWRPLQPPRAEPEVMRRRPANSAPQLDERPLWRAGERQFLATFRPRLVVREVTWARDGNSVSLAIENVGGTPCKIVESDFLLRDGAFDGRVLRTAGKNRMGKVTLAVGQFHDHVHPFDAGEESFQAGFSKPKEGDGLLEPAFFMGTIVYQDRIRIRRRIAFLRICEAGSSLRFMRSKNPEDEYADQ